MGTNSYPTSAPSNSTDPSLTRRHILAGAAWAVPAVALTASTPAFAASSALLMLSTPNMQVPASGAVTVTATLKNASGAATAGASVSFTGPSGATINPASAVTNGTGAATTGLNLKAPWTKPGSTVAVNATSGSESKSQSFTVIGSNLVAAGNVYSSTPAQTELVFPSPAVDAVASGGSFAVLLNNGTVWTKGDNSNGQLGDNTSSDRSTWAQVPGLSNVTQIAAGSGSLYALLSDGSVKAWGYNAFGQLGDGTTTPRYSPTPVSNLSGVTQIAAGGATAFALLSDKSVKAWGYNNVGQVGDGSTTNRSTPSTVSNLSNVDQIAAGRFRTLGIPDVATAYALLSDGSVKAWGFNNAGQVGDGTTTSRSAPTPVLDVSGATQVAAGSGTGFVLLSDGSVRGWGRNNVGQVGDGTTTNRSRPTTVTRVASAVQVSAAAGTAYAMSSDGSVRSWGYNTYGQIGDGSTTDRPAPVSLAVPAGHSVERLASNGSGAETVFLVMATT